MPNQKQNKKYIIFILIPLAIAGFWFVRDKTDGLEWLKIENSGISVEIADSPSERTLGLSGRDSLPENQGLLFVFDKEDYYPFWMKDMKFPIDIIWIGADGRVTTIKNNILPSTYPNTFASDKMAKYVLEVNTGWASKKAIKVGDNTNVQALVK